MPKTVRSKTAAPETPPAGGDVDESLKAERIQAESLATGRAGAKPASGKKPAATGKRRQGGAARPPAPRARKGSRTSAPRRRA